VEDCQARFSALRADAATTATFANGKDQVGLLDEIDNASTAGSAGKNAAEDAGGSNHLYRVDRGLGSAAVQRRTRVAAGSKSGRLR
jgi:hypothetical protein